MMRYRYRVHGKNIFEIRDWMDRNDLKGTLVQDRGRKIILDTDVDLAAARYLDLMSQCPKSLERLS